MNVEEKNREQNSAQTENTRVRPESEKRKEKVHPESVFPSLRCQPMENLQVDDNSYLGDKLPILAIAMAVLFVLLVIIIPAGCHTFFNQNEQDDPIGDNIPDQPSETGSSITTPGGHPFADGPEGNVLLPYNADVQGVTGDQVNSVRSCVVDLSTGTIIAGNRVGEKMYPASLTKIMTLIVAVENLPENVSLKKEITISKDVVNAMVKENASGMGLAAGEKLTVEALLYMSVLQSDGVASIEIAKYIAGSEEEFVSLMNRKASSMGLTNTHFANATGLQDEGNYSTCRDMATIMYYAMNMSLCRQILTSTVYTAPTVSDKGKDFSYTVLNALLVTKLQQEYPSYVPKKVTITAGKTGWTGRNSGFCLASYATTKDGHAYIVVTSQSDTYLDCIKDHAYLYDTYAK